MFKCRLFSANSGHPPNPKHAVSFDILRGHIVKDDRRLTFSFSVWAVAIATAQNIIVNEISDLAATEMSFM